MVSAPVLATVTATAPVKVRPAASVLVGLW